RTSYVSPFFTTSTDTGLAIRPASSSLHVLTPFLADTRICASSDDRTLISPRPLCTKTCVCRNRLRRNFYVIGIVISTLVQNRVANLLSPVFHAHHDPQQREHPHNQHHFAPRDSPGRRAASPRSSGPLVQFHRSPENNDQRPPVPEEMAQVQMPVVMQQQDHSPGDQNQPRK